METKFTKGPWELRDVASAGLQIYGQVAERLEMTEREPGAPLPRMLWHLLSFEPWRQFPVKYTDEMNRANARLICAAPDLFAALEALCGAVQMLDVTAEEAAAIEPLIAEAQGALKKAVTP